LLKSKRISDITYLRTIVESSSHGLGYLAGDLAQKVSVYLEPLYEKMREFVDKPVIDNLIAEQRVEGKPINFLRGSSWNVKYVLMDEAQNATFKELLTVVTRVGRFTKLVVVGDSMQADIRNSGFQQMMDVFDNQEAREQGIYVKTLNHSDIVRSGIVQFIVTQIERYHKEKIK